MREGSYRPAETMALAPVPRSSAGWKRKIRVPDQEEREEMRVEAAARREVVWKSWPHAGIYVSLFPVPNWKRYEIGVGRVFVNSQGENEAVIYRASQAASALPHPA